MKKKRILVIGSNSFIAKSVMSFLSKKKYDIIKIHRDIIDLENINAVKKIKRIVRSNDIIFFAAANAPVKDITIFQKNLTMCFNFCQATKDKKIRKFIYLSSDAVYSDSKKKLNEKSATKPLSLHGMMHLMRENIFQLNFENNLSIIRPTLVYGKNDPHNGYGPNKFNRTVKLKKEVNIFGKGEERRDHIHIDDVGNIISKIIDKNLKGTFNVVSGHVISFHAIAKKFIKLSRDEVKINYIKRIGPMPHDGYRGFSNAKLKNLNLIKDLIKINDLKSFF